MTLLSILIALATAGCGKGQTQIRFDHVQEHPAPQPAGQTLRLGVVTLLSPKESFSAYRNLADYLGAGVGLKTDLVLRKTYSEMNDLVRTGAVDVALVGYGGYEAGRKQYGTEALASAQVDGITSSQALLVVRSDSPVHQFTQLEQRAVAFTDPLSYSGHLTLRNWMAEKGLRPERFFSKTPFTFSHDGAVEAVIGRVVDAAVVDAYLFRTYLAHHPELDGKLRVVTRFPTPGSLCFVVRPDLPAGQKEQLRDQLLRMSDSTDGRRVLTNLVVERFVPPPREDGNR